jgi:Mg2+ and Co2+ transporter CorA
MNVGLPGGADPAGGVSASFWVIVGVMIAVLVAMIGYFRKRGFL